MLYLYDQTNKSALVDGGKYFPKSTLYIIQHWVQHVYLTVNSEHFRECKSELLPRFCFCQVCMVLKRHLLGIALYEKKAT